MYTLNIANKALNLFTQGIKMFTRIIETNKFRMPGRVTPSALKQLRRFPKDAIIRNTGTVRAATAGDGK